VGCKRCVCLSVSSPWLVKPHPIHDKFKPPPHPPPVTCQFSPSPSYVQNTILFPAPYPFLERIAMSPGIWSGVIGFLTACLVFPSPVFSTLVNFAKFSRDHLIPLTILQFFLCSTSKDGKLSRSPNFPTSPFFISLPRVLPLFF